MSRLDSLTDRLCSHDTAALARAISLAEASSSMANDLHDRVKDKSGQAAVIGVTGAPGVGKSTLLNCLIHGWRQRDKRVAVIAVDPSSPITGGAVLGDRTRMGEHSEDPDVFIRSVAARGHLGGLSADILCIIDLVDAAGWDIIFLETVGTGQSETEVMSVTDFNLVINAPGLGDDVQAIKAGILEIADILVINKADSPLAARTERQLKAMLQLREESNQDVPVVSTVATERKGIDELIKAIMRFLEVEHTRNRKPRHEERVRHLMAEEMAQQVRSHILAGADLDLVKALIERLRQQPPGELENVRTSQYQLDC